MIKYILPPQSQLRSILSSKTTTCRARECCFFEHLTLLGKVRLVADKDHRYRVVLVDTDYLISEHRGVFKRVHVGDRKDTHESLKKKRKESSDQHVVRLDEKKNNKREG